MTALSREIRATFLISAAVAVVLMLPTLLQQPLSLPGQLETVATPPGVIESLEGGVFVPPGMSSVTPGIIPESFGSPGVVTTPGLGTTTGPMITTTPSVTHFSTPTGQQAPQAIYQQGGSRRTTVEQTRALMAKIQAQSRVAGIAEARRTASLKQAAGTSPTTLSSTLATVGKATLRTSTASTYPIFSNLSEQYTYAIEGLPAYVGVTTISSTSFTLAASSRAAAGVYAATLVGTALDGGRIVRAPFLLEIVPVLRSTSGTFDVSVDSTLAVRQGGKAAARVILEGARKEVKLSLRGAPTGVTISPTSCVVNCDALVVVGPDARPGSYAVTVTGSADGEVRSASMVITVRAPTSSR